MWPKHTNSSDQQVGCATQSEAASFTWFNFNAIGLSIAIKGPKRTQLFPPKIRVLVPTNEMSKYLVQIRIIHQSGFSSSCRVTSFRVSGLQNWSRLIRRSVQHEFRHWVNRWIFFNLVLYHHENSSKNPLCPHHNWNDFQKETSFFQWVYFECAILFFAESNHHFHESRSFMSIPTPRCSWMYHPHL